MWLLPLRSPTRVCLHPLFLFFPTVQKHSLHYWLRFKLSWRQIVRLLRLACSSHVLLPLSLLQFKHGCSRHSNITFIYKLFWFILVFWVIVSEHVECIRAAVDIGYVRSLFNVTVKGRYRAAPWNWIAIWKKVTSAESGQFHPLWPLVLT